MSNTILYKHSLDKKADGSAKTPNTSQLDYGEIAINYAKDVETISIKNSNNEIVSMRLRDSADAINIVTEHQVNVNNPHNVTKTQLELDNVDNTSDADKPVTIAMQNELDKKQNVADIYNSIAEDSTKDLTKLPWASSQAYSMNNSIDAYIAQDTSAIEVRIKNCEDNV